jgi:prefoldin subunit 5
MLRFQESGECVSKLSGNSDGKEILVPLTGSMYVPGTLVESEKVIIVPVRHYEVPLLIWTFSYKIFFF